VGTRSRVLTVVALAAGAAVAATVGVTLLQTRGETTKATPASAAVTSPRPGAPPLELDFGLRTDPEARALTQAAVLYTQGHRAQAGRVFARYHSLAAQIGAAFSAWPKGGLEALKHLVASHSHSSLAELHLGLAYYWSGRTGDAVAAFKRAASLEPDTSFALNAETILHPEMPPYPLPVFVPSSPPPAGVEQASGRRQLAILSRLAARPGPVAKIYYGIALQGLGRAVSAERQFAAAAAAAPDDPEALAAAAVGRFTKDHPERAFSRLGPLAERFPHAAVVRFHLGYLLVWIGAHNQAVKELRLAVADAPKSVYAVQATKLLAALRHTGTK
jgi:tetratricopeptide (TPR) repeat protein